MKTLKKMFLSPWTKILVTVLAAGTMSLYYLGLPTPIREPPTIPTTSEYQRVNEAAVAQGYCGCSILCHDGNYKVTYLKEGDPSIPYAVCAAPPSLCLTRLLWDDECKEQGVQTL